MSDFPGELFPLGGAGHRELSVALPAGRLVGFSAARPVLWISDEPAPPGYWPMLRADHPRSGLWPLLLDGTPPLTSTRMSDPGDHAVTALSPALPLLADPGEYAGANAEKLLASRPWLRLGLVATTRGSDALAVIGWQGRGGDTGELAAVLRSWDERFGTRVLGAGPHTLWLSVAGPPSSQAEAVRVAAEHAALCPGIDIPAYAERLIDASLWELRWR